MVNIQMNNNDTKRVEALRKYDILDTPLDGNFDRITELAATIFKVPIAIISLVDTERIWFKSHYGIPVNQLDRDPGLCASAILSKDVYIVEDALEDPRTLANPLVAGDFGLRFYAAAPLTTEDHYNLGTLCIIDKAPRLFTDKEREILEQLGKIVMDEMEMRLALRNAVQSIRNLTADINANLKKTIHGIQASAPEAGQHEAVISHLEASRMFMLNVENQLNHI